jgi:hypothetical protein
MGDVGPYVISAVVAIVCFFISVYFTWVTFYKLSKSDIRDPANQAMLTLSIIALTMFMLHQLLSFIDYSYSAATGKENEVLSIAGALYIIGRLFVYGIFIHRLKYVVQGTFNPYPQRVIVSVYSLLMLIIVFIVVLLIGFISGNEPILYAGGFCFILCDLILCIILPLLFVGKLYQLVELKESVERISENTTAAAADPVMIETSTNKENTTTNMNASIELNSTGGKTEVSLPSIAQIGATTENAPVTANKNKFKYDTILFAAGKISLLSCVALISMILVLPIGIGLQGYSNDTWPGTIPEILIKVDEVVNVICICLCFKINDDWYLQLCSDGHSACQKRPCYACWKCCKGCVSCCLE